MVDDILSINEYNFRREEQLFLDTNIWLFVFGPQYQPTPEVEIYSSAFHRILDANCSIFIDVTVVSEFINAYSRMRWRQTGRSRYRVFKNFRNSRQFEPIAQEVADDITRVLSYCSFLNSRFNHTDMSNMICEYAEGGVDFNDQVIGNLCRARNLTLITDDQDFRNQGISVLTANNRLLR